MQRKRPVFGTISLVLMLGLFAAGIFMSVGEPPKPVSDGDGLAVVIEATANAMAILLAIISVSICSMIVAVVSLIRREPPLVAGVALSLAIPPLLVVVFWITRL